MKQLLVKVDESLHKQVKMYAAAHGLTMADVVVIGVEFVLNHNKGDRPEECSRLCPHFDSKK